MAPKKILFFTCEAGGAETLIPVIDSINKHPEYEAVVLSYGYARERFTRKRISFIETTPFEKNDVDFLKRYLPHFIITSATSLPSNDMSEKHIWYNSRKLGFPTIAFLDQWQNYSLRFSGNQKRQLLKYLPDQINCINNIAKTEMIAEGFSSDILVPLGHPYLSYVKEQYRFSHRENIHKQHNIPIRNEIVLFASEAIREHYGNSRGYNQYEVIEGFLECFTADSDKKTILLKLHPRENVEAYDYLIKKNSGIDIRILTNQLTPLECLAASDKVYGMTSMMLIEAYIIGKPVVTIQPNLRIPDPLVLSRHGFIPLITSLDHVRIEPLQNPQTKKFPYKFNWDKLYKILDA
jgi:hypothetical protein